MGKMQLILIVTGLFFLLLAGCIKQETPCATNNDCPSGAFCVNERCTTLSCSEEGGGCKRNSDCCSSLECINYVCEQVPELERTAKVLVSESGTAEVYGVFVKVGKVLPEFDSGCRLLNGSAEIELGYGPDTTRGTVFAGEMIKAGKASARLDALIGNATYGGCDIESKEIVLGVSRESVFEGPLAVGTGIEISAGGPSIRLLKIEPASAQNGKCRYPRTASIEVRFKGEQYTVTVGNDKPVAVKNAVFILDQPNPFNDSECIGPDPKLRASFFERDQVLLKEGTSATALGDVSIMLDRAEASSVGNPCTITDATAHLSVKPSYVADIGSIAVKKGEFIPFSNLQFNIDEVRGKLLPSWSTCAFKDNKLLLGVLSPEGAGGTFAPRTPIGSSLFIEVVTEREEKVVSGSCPANDESSVGYSFNDDRREFSSLSVKPSGPVLVAYGNVKKFSGNSNGIASELFTGSEMPFEQGELKVLGANKNGDASLAYKGVSLVLAAGKAFSREMSSTEALANCTLEVRTIETVMNYGFVKAPG